MSMKPKALILHAAGINRDLDAAFALEAAGAEADIVHVNQLRDDPSILRRGRILVIPGGFSYADALGAGRLFALDIAAFFKDEVSRFVDEGKPVIGICNGFQTLVKAGLLPGRQFFQTDGEERRFTLSDNRNGRFECRWVSLKAEKSPCIWTKDIEESIVCPVAHGEGRFLAASQAHLDALVSANLVALRYTLPSGEPAAETWPYNPNGSPYDIAGICNPRGNVLGLMPHPEDNVITGPAGRSYHGGRQGSGLSLFKNGVRHAIEQGAIYG